METLKPLDQIIEMDARNKAHGFTLAARHKQVSDLELSPDVPEPILSAFAVAQNLWLYGWFCWPLYTLASFEAFRCIEMALINRWRDAGSPPLSKRPSKRTPPLKQLFGMAIGRGWLSDGDFQHVRRHQECQRAYNEMLAGSLPAEAAKQPKLDRYVNILKDVLPDLRNSHAHSGGITIAVPDYGFAYLETARDIIQRLFPASSAPSPPPAGR